MKLSQEIISRLDQVRSAEEFHAHTDIEWLKWSEDGIIIVGEAIHTLTNINCMFRLNLSKTINDPVAYDDIINLPFHFTFVWNAKFTICDSSDLNVFKIVKVFKNPNIDRTLYGQLSSYMNECKLGRLYLNSIKGGLSEVTHLLDQIIMCL